MAHIDGNLADRISECPHLGHAGRAREILDELIEQARTDPALCDLADVLAHKHVSQFLLAVLAGSPYLANLMTRQPMSLQDVLCQNPEERLPALCAQLQSTLDVVQTPADAMRELRLFKAKIALLTALADLAGVWPVMQVTDALSRAADAAVQGAVRFLFRQATSKGDWLSDTPVRAADTSGYIVLAMGKYGAFELNYSSDIDLIVLFDYDRVCLREGLEAPVFFVRLTRDLVRLLQERTVDGYVFRTDLRLRPDPGATQVALSTDAALIYYESFGQNWERAALIKARAVAGDIPCGEALLEQLSPFIWRKYLDFAAIADVHAMKRQIHAVKGFSTIAVAGHNIKLGRGGIREIEFFTQTQQLIAGGRQPDLRISTTLAALQRLVERGWITEDVRADLAQAYVYLRRIEHRLQMVADEQTHVLPKDEDRLHAFACFSGYAGTAEFSTELIAQLECVQGHYEALFESDPQLTDGRGNLMFTGDDDDPETVATLAAMGFSDPSLVISAVRGWHHGRYAAVRSPTARERLTKVQPALIDALAGTIDPHRALIGFDRFLAALPAGVQLFALLRSNPNLLRLVAHIVGSAPRLAGILSRHRRVLDAVLDPGFFGRLPGAADLDALIEAELREATDYQDTLDRARRVGHEQAFLIGVRVLSGTIAAHEAGGAYARIAEMLIDALHGAVEAELAHIHGRMPAGEAVVIAMGKLGGREMTAASDLDLIVVYDFAEDATQSDGRRPLAGSQYYARYTQRLISALNAPTSEGSLYEVDMRLRPSGQKGPVATRFESFVHYQNADAWTWEHLALTRARIISGPEKLRNAVDTAINDVLTKPRDRAQVTAAVHDMRARVWSEKGTDDIWDLKQARGGLVDLEFITQYLQLTSASKHPEVLNQNTKAALLKLTEVGVLPARQADSLIPAADLLHNLTQILRLCLDGRFVPNDAPDGMKALLAQAGGTPDFQRLEGLLRETLADVARLFDEIVQ